MTKLQRFKKIAAKAVPIIGNMCLFVGAGATISLIWSPADEYETAGKVLMTTWVALVPYFAIMANKFRRLANDRAAEEHRDGYLRGVVSMILAHRKLYEQDDPDYMQTVVTSANNGLVDWRDQWAVPMKDEFERLEND